jgi:hypothetical protein
MELLISGLVEGQGTFRVMELVKIQTGAPDNQMVVVLLVHNSALMLTTVENVGMMIPVITL